MKDPTMVLHHQTILHLIILQDIHHQEDGISLHLLIITFLHLLDVEDFLPEDHLEIHSIINKDQVHMVQTTVLREESSMVHLEGETSIEEVECHNRTEKILGRGTEVVN